MDAKTSEWRAGPNVCRCCLTEGCYKDISTEYFWMGKREVYAEMLLDTLNVTISYSQSGGPNSNSRLICELCISRLRDASDFRRQVLECEKTFMQHLDLVTPSLSDLEVHAEPIDSGVKLEEVKQEKRLSDDEFDDNCGFDDDDDDLDDQPLTTLASKIPKKESVDILDLLDNTKAAEKRKSSTKTKATPTKKSKTVRKEVVKPSASKVPAKTEKKKKDLNYPNKDAKRNAEIIMEYSTVYPFKLPEKYMVCWHCSETFVDPAQFRTHMDEVRVHEAIKTRTALYYSEEHLIKVDCTHITCRICNKHVEKLQQIAEHLYSEHNKPLDLSAKLPWLPFQLESNKFVCGICDNDEAISLRHLNSHIHTHFWRYTCEACGRSYVTKKALNQHIKRSHEHMCYKCRSTFSSIKEKMKHREESSQCWTYVCKVCGERFQNYSLRQQHLSDFHRVKNDIIVCSKCGLQFQDNKKYTSHYKHTHSGDNNVYPARGKKFLTKRKRESHQNSHTSYMCNLCGKKFGHKHIWINHMKLDHAILEDFETINDNFSPDFPDFGDE